MTPKESTLLARFLGDRAASGVPLDILGLARGTLTDAEVLGARDRRIRELDGHPLAHTPEADEVRLAVHAAAVNLLDPRVRAILSAAPPAPPRPIETRPAEPAPATRAAPPAREERSFERDALVTIGMHGGWGPRARRRIAMLAHLHNLPPRAVAAVLARLSHAGAGARARSPSARPYSRASVAAMPEAEPIDDAWKIAAGAAAAVLISAVMLTTLVVVIIRSDPGGGRAPRAAAGPGAVAPAAPSAGGFIPAAREDLSEANEIAHELRSAAAALRAGHADALDRYRAAAGRLARGWTDQRPQDVHDANRAAFNFLAADGAEETGLIGDLAGLIGAPAVEGEAITSSVWAAGMLARAAADPALTPERRAEARRALQSAGLAPASPTFNAGVGAELARRGAEIDPANAVAWAAWARAHQAGAFAQTPEGDRIVRAALAGLLRRPGEPSPEAIELLVGAAAWRAEGGARPWLIAQFDAADVRTARLAMVLDAIARASPAAGVLPSMTLDPGATLAERGELRAAYARAWSLDQTERVADELSAALAGELAAAVEGSRRAGTAVERTRQLAVLARANAMAARAVAGDTGAASEEWNLGLERLDDALRAGTSQAFDVNAPVTGDGDWAAGVLGIDDKDEPALIAAVTRAGERDTALGPADAGVLAQLAFRGASSGVREAASRSLTRHANDPHVLLVTIDMLDGVPRNETNAATLETMTRQRVWTGVREEFYPGARRALLTRLLALIAGDSPEARVDALAAMIDAYAHWAATGESIGADAPPAHASARALRAKLASAVRPSAALRETGLDPGSIERRAASARALARSPVARLVVEQRALAQTLGASLVARRPDAAPRVGAALRVLEQEDASARSVLDQAMAGERAIAVLWQMSLTMEVAP